MPTRPVNPVDLRSDTVTRPTIEMRAGHGGLRDGARRLAVPVDQALQGGG